ncbi:uncharacterized protein LOC130828146 isoform X2 [Amaranthus tricolor]|uniref:uncharacterized protein LOC130828146 isoform X2 n=1 Tax=Amaranthus tricolor TaxID=29722 RepID=UPI00258F5D8A|nr:uncharacterized protein LOC130828146 isoform X2 [Amaranthus tricolor]XP_057549948.1 uncharacterized protein LOC130828146 isoform X2 [Amaranthus tricolor]
MAPFTSYPIISGRRGFYKWDIFFKKSHKGIHTSQHKVHNNNEPPFSGGGTYSFLDASCFQHNFKNWQNQRKNKLTSSTFSYAIGFWPRRRVQLWLEKIGAIEPFSGNCATCWNNINEEVALERYKLITGKSVFLPKSPINKHNFEDDWLGASPDGVVEETIYGLRSGGVLEIKCPFFDGNKSRAFPWKRIPVHYMPQAQGLMEILDKDWMDFYVWTLNGSSLFRLYRDAEYWDTIKIALDDFWWNHVQPAKELYNKFYITKPLTQLRSLKPEPRHELCSYIVCESKRLVNNSKLLVFEINGELQDY